MLITGTPSADTLLGQAGDDTIFGWEGNDRILDSSGNNIVNGNEGDDTIYGAQENDLLRGGKGNDILYGDKGDNTVFGDKGNDLIFVGVGNNLVNGNEGNDTIYGAQENDLLRGGKNQDLIFGNAGDDTIYGDWGADTITGMGGDDIFVIGRTNNAITRTTGGLNREDADVITDFENGRDLISITGGLSYADLDIQQGIDIDANNTIIKDKFTGEYLVVLLNNPSNSISESIFIAEKTSVSGFTININSLALNELVKLPANLNTNEDTDLVFNNQNTISERDINLFNFPIKVTLSAQNGKLTLNSTDGLTFNNGNNGSANITFTGNLSNINSAINKFTFTPDRNFNGNTSISVLAEIDSVVGLAGNKISSTIPVTVTPVNDEPVNKVPGNQIINENETLIFNGDKAISIADIDAGDNPVQVTLTTNNGTLNLNTTNGLVFKSGNNGDRYLSFSGKIGNINANLNNSIFTPDPDFTGNTSISIITEDLGNTGGGNLSDRDTINISVVSINQAPVNIVPDRQFILQNTPLIFNTNNKNLISISDSDAGNNPIQVTLSTNNGTLSLGGTNGLTLSDGTPTTSSRITFSGTISNINTAINGLTFTPTNNFIGNTNISLTTNDLGNSGSGGAKITSSSIPINVGNANNIPVNQVPGKQVTTSNTPIIFNTANNNQITISDSDAGNNSIQVTLTTNNGNILLKDPTGLTFIGGTANNSASITVTGTISDINKALNGLAFIPKNNFEGDDSITINTDDLVNTGVGGSQIATSKIPITNKITIDGNNQHQIFDVYNTETTFNNLIIINGKGSNNRAGGIHIQGSKVSVSNSIFSQSTSTARGGAIHNSSGSILEIINSTFDRNVSSSFTGGGAISNNGNLTITNSTISNNSAFPFIGGGGGIANIGTLIINNSTIAKNYSDNSGGGIYNAGKVIASHTIIADNTDSGSSPDFDGELKSNGYNLIGNTTGTTIIGDTTGNILNRSAKLDSLKDNGGLTRTMALLSGSPAINAGNPNFSNLNPDLLYDQRGFDRILQNRIDIGAFESNLF